MLQTSISQPLLLSAPQSLLVLVDVQQRLVAKIGAAAELVRNCQRLLLAANQLQVPVLVTEHCPEKLGPTEEKLRVNLPVSSAVVSKTYFNAAAADEFLSLVQLSQRSQVVIAGLEAHVCVLQTCLGLASNYQVWVVEDAIASRTLAHRDNALHRLRAAGIGVCNHESLIFEWLEDARHPQLNSLLQSLR